MRRRAVGGDEVVAVAFGGGRDADDGLVEVEVLEGVEDLQRLSQPA
jgi:hypothetical protein